MAEADGKRKGQIRAVIFDMDGTLLDTLPDITAAFNSVFAARGLRQFTLDEFRHFVGNGLRHAMESALDSCGVEQVSPDELEQMMEVMVKIYSANPTDKTVPYDGMPEIITMLNQAGIPLAVHSNKLHDLTERIIRHFFPDYTTLFTEVLGKSDRFPLKPAPDATRFLMEQMGSGPDETLMIGDTSVDYRTAEAAGCRSMTVSWGFRTAEELAADGCVPLISSVEELAAVLKREIG